MKFRISLWSAAFLVGGSQAQEAENEWTIESYQIPLTYVGAPAFPDETADKAAIENFIRESHEFVSGRLKMRGLIFPEGALFAFDPKSVTLAARLPRDWQKLVQRDADTDQIRRAKFIAWNVRILEAPAATIRAAIGKAAETPNHRQLLAELLSLNEVEVVAALSGESKSGQRSQNNQSNDVLLTQNLEPIEENSTGFEIRSRETGTLLEIDTTIDFEETGLHINLALEHHFGPPITSTKIIKTGENSEISRNLVSTFQASVITTLHLSFGGSKLLGTWKPQAEDSLQAAFLTADVVDVLPAANPAVRQLLEKHGEAVLAVPDQLPDPLRLNSANERSEPIPDGMIERVFRVPPGISVPEAPSDDPFGEFDLDAGLARRNTPQKILTDQGIPFPDGSFVIFTPSTGELVVRNTPANMDLVEAYVASITPSPVKTLGIAIHIVEAPADWLRDLMAEARNSADDSEAWKKFLEAEKRGEAKFLRSSWINGSSGQRTRISAGRVEPLIKKVAPGSEPDEPWKITTEDRLAGLFLELDPVIGADGRTIDLNLSLNYDYAPPTLLEPVDGSKLSHDRIFHQTRILTSAPFWAGAIRMVGSWTPRDAPGFENAEVLQAAFVRADILMAD